MADHAGGKPLTRADSLEGAFRNIVDISARNSTGSPLFAIVPRGEGSDSDSDGADVKGAATTLQRFVKSQLRRRKDAAQLAARLRNLGFIERDLSPLAAFVEAVNARAAAGGPGDARLSEAMAMLASDAQLLKTAEALVAQLDRRVSPRKRATRARSSKAFLSSLLVCAFPAETLAFSDEAEMAAATGAPALPPVTGPAALYAAPQYADSQKRLYNAARLQRLAILGLQKALAAPPLGGGASEAKAAWAHANRVADAMGVLRFFRNYACYSFAKWRFEDSERLAAGIIQQYASALAMHEGLRLQLDSDPAAMQDEMRAVLDDVQRKLDGMENAVKRLIGPKKTKESLDEVRAAVLEDVRMQLDALNSSAAEMEAKEAEAASAASAAAAAAVPAAPGSPAQAPAAPGAGATAAPVSPGGGTEGLSGVNEILAHEILLNPNLRIIDDTLNRQEQIERDPLGDPKRLHQILGLNNPLVGDLNDTSSLPPFPWEDNAETWGVLQPDASATTTTPADVGRALHKLFWEKLVLGLVPSDIASAADLKIGDAVQVRYGSRGGAFFGAHVVATRSSGTMDVRYDTDNVVEENVEAARIRLRDDPPDVMSLLGLFGELGTALEGLTPRNQRLVAETRDILAPQSVAERLQATDFKHGPLLREVADCLRFAIDRLANLIAPAREGDYHAWARQVGSRLDLWSSGAESAATGDWKELVFCLPAVLSRLFHTITLTKADSLQAQVDALRPVLGMHGANYERSKFLSRLAQGLGAADPEHASFPPADVLRALPRTHRLLSMLLQTMGKAANTTAVHLYKSDEWKALYDKPVDAANALTGEAAGSIISTLKAGGAKLRFASGAVFSHIILHLLQAPVRLDAGPDLVLPEFLVLDASRFAKARDVLDRACLVVAMATLTQQVAARNRRVFGLAQMQALIERLNILLRDGTSGGAGQNVTLPALVDECVRAAEGSAPGTELPKEEVAALRVLIPNAASADHAIFKIVHKRVLGAWVHFLPFTHPDFLGRSEGAIPSSLDVASRDEGERAIARVSPGFNQTELGKELIAVGDALGKVMRHSIVVQGELVTALLQHLVRI